MANLKISTGLRNKLLDTNGLKTILALGFIDIYSGTAPSSPDDAATGTKLCRISNNATATGLTFAASASGGVLSKNSSEVWSGTNLATGTAAYFRFVAAGDDATLSTTQARIQGDVAVVGADLNLSSVSLTSGATQTVDYFSVAMPSV